MSVLLVTGGSRGIGAGVACLAAERGWDVAVNYTANADSAEEVVAAVRACGRRGLAVQADVSVPADVDAMFDRVHAELGPLHGLVNSAGVGTGVGPIETLDVDATRRMFEINILGTYLCCRRGVLAMSTGHGGEGGSIVNISSASARTGSPGAFVDYATSKGAVDILTVGLAKEQGSQGIRVNGVRPGVISTDMVAEAAAKNPEWLEGVIATTPNRRIGEVPDVATAVLWLLSQEARHTSGAIIDISGGRVTP